jgi:hypothetical protein
LILKLPSELHPISINPSIDKESHLIDAPLSLRTPVLVIFNLSHFASAIIPHKRIVCTNLNFAKSVGLDSSICSLPKINLAIYSAASKTMTIELANRRVPTILTVVAKVLRRATD